MNKQRGVAAGAERLTETQRQCLRLTYQHMTSKEIAPRLGLSPHSVDAHIRIAMKVLGVDSRREAALALNELEAAQPARRKPAGIPYEAADSRPQAYASEASAPGWTYPANMSNLGASEEQLRNISAMTLPVEQSGPTGAVIEPVLKEAVIRNSLWNSGADYSVKKKVMIVLLTALLSALAFTTIVSGFAAMSLLVSGEGSAR